MLKANDSGEANCKLCGSIHVCIGLTRTKEECSNRKSSVSLSSMYFDINLFWFHRQRARDSSIVTWNVCHNYQRIK
jgi:hypothetical protein